MRRAALSACLLAACAGAETAGGGGGDDDAGPADAAAPDAAGPPPVPDTRILYFTHGPDVWLASAAGTEGREICAASRIAVSRRGERALCIPSDPAAPLRLFDLGIQRVLHEYPTWRAGSLGTPALSPDGSKVAFADVDAEGVEVVRVFDDGGHELGVVGAFGVVAFPGDDALLLDVGDPAPAIWRLGEAMPRPVPGGHVTPVGPEPGGAVYEVTDPDFAVKFAGPVDRELGPGLLGGVFDTRVLVVPVSGDGPARLVDVAEPAFGLDVALPPVPFDRIRGTRLVAPALGLFEERTSALCGGTPALTSSRTVWHDLVSNASVELAAGGPHVAGSDQRGRHALVLDLDRCGVAPGTGRVVDLATGTARPFTDFLPDAVRAATLSPDGRFVALALDAGVRVLDLATGIVRVAASGAPGGAAFHFF